MTEEKETDVPATEEESEEKPDSIKPDPPARVATTTTTRKRRWHTLSGAVALGVFLIEHLLTNASALGGEGQYDKVVGSIERMSILPILELIFIAIPLGYHVVVGIQLLRASSTPDREIDRYGDRRLWVVQRLSGIVVLVFVLVHLWELRLQRLFFGAEAASLYTRLTGHLSYTWLGIPWIALFYLIGIGAATFHFSNGLFAATDAWGVWKGSGSGPGPRRTARLITSGLGVVLFLIGAVSVIGLATGTRLLSAADAEGAPCGAVIPAASGASSGTPASSASR